VDAPDGKVRLLMQVYTKGSLSSLLRGKCKAEVRPYSNQLCVPLCAYVC
jgi:hypothetical protein